MSASDVFFNLLADPDPPSQATADAFIAQADALIAGYLTLPGADLLPDVPAMHQARGMLALVLYNRRGAEGETKRAEGDVVTWFESMPDIIRIQLRPFRNARALAWLLAILTPLIAAGQARRLHP